jgi:hypothetical protein
MPKSLLARCRPDSIREFRASALQRYDDGLTAAAGSRGLAAIYLWGYSAEMLLKAAYLSLLGFDEEKPFPLKSIHDAVKLGQGLGIPWPTVGQGHNVRAWAELLILERATHPDPAMAYAMDFQDDVQAHGQRIGRLWNETLRYRRNTPYLYEIAQVRIAVEWFIVHSDFL